MNPDRGEVDSNPFDVAALTGGSALVADAGGNSVLIVKRNGNVDWVATLPNELVSTANAKTLPAVQIRQRTSHLCVTCRLRLPRRRSRRASSSVPTARTT